MEDIEKLADRIILIDEGKKVWEGGIESLINKVDYKKVTIIHKKPEEIFNKLKNFDGVKEVTLNRNKVTFFIKRDKIADIKEFIDNNLLDIKIESPSLEDLIKDLYEELGLSGKNEEAN